MDKIHDHHDDDYDRVHRETFEAWRRANLEEVSLSTLRTMERRLRKTLGEMHEQVHQCREEMGLPARNWPVFQYCNPPRTKKKERRRIRSRRDSISPYVPPNDPAVRKAKVKGAIRRYRAFLKRVQAVVRTKQAGMPRAPSI